MISTKDFINLAGFRDGDATKASAGEIVFQNASIDAPVHEWLPELQAGLIKNSGVVEAREFLAPTVSTSLNGNTVYHYRFFPTKESIPSVVDSEKLARGWNGEFSYVDAENEVRTAKLDSVGLSMVVEKEMEKADPGYYARAYAKLTNIIESATLLTALNALEAIATAYSWTSSDGDFDAFLSNALEDASDNAGTDLNRVLIGRRAWLARLAYLNASSTAGGFLLPRTAEQLGDQINADVLIPKARISSGETFPSIASSKVYGFIGVDGATNEDVSNLKMFTSGGLKMNRWEHPQGELEILTVSRYQKIQAVYPLGAVAISIS